MSDQAGALRPAICYVVPDYRVGASQHFAHLPRLLSEVSKLCRLFVIVERGVTPDLPNAEMVVAQQASGGRIGRYLELVRIVRTMRKRGCARYFVRISHGAGLVLSLLAPFLRIRVYYWNSGQGRRGWPSFRADPVRRTHLFLLDLLTMLLVNVVHRFVTGPESMVDYYVSEYRVPRKRCLLLYNDIDLSTRVPLCAESRGRVRRDRSLADDTVYVLFVGRVSNLKGGRPLLEVAERLGEAPPCSLCRILVVGEIHLSDVGRRLESLTTVDVLGSMSNEEAFRYFQAADVFVLPSLSEGFPRVVLEAMAAGLPIASFDVGGVRDILGEMQQQFVVPWGDTGALADAVRALVDHRNLREELGQENLRLVRRFDTAVVAEMFVRAIGGEA